MDKKSTFIGILLIGLAVGLMFFNAKNAPQPAPAPVATPATSTAIAPAQPAAVPAKPAPVFSGEKKIFTLENGKIALRLSSFGGAFESVELKDFPQSQEDRNPVVFNDKSSVPALTLAGAPATLGAAPAPWNIVFSVESDVTDDAAKTRTVTLVGADSQKTVRRVYTVSLDDEGRGAADPYLVRHNIKLAPVAGADSVPATDLYLSTGMLPPTNGDTANLFLNASWFNGDSYDKIDTGHFKASGGFLGLGAHPAYASYVAPAEAGEPFQWVATTNQYFANILAFPQADVRPLISELAVFPEKLVPAEDADNKTDLSVVGFARVKLPALRSLNLETLYYVGPKEYTRFADLQSADLIEDADLVVQFTSLFGFISIDWLCKILVAVMNWIHELIPANAWSWGWVIVVMTLIVKGITWPLTMAQQRSAKKMQKFSKPMQDIRERYKDNPQKMQQEMMKLYRDNKINPLAGCFPVLIQIPIFFAMYCTFQTCAELRLQPFLWIPDLSMPDVIPGLEDWRIPFIGAQIHILPILMGATMFLNMKMTPMPNAQPGQKNMFYAMMAIFPIICYTMPSALTLYWTLQNIFTMFQTWLVRRARDDEKGGNAKSGNVEIIPPTKKKGRGKGRVTGINS